MNHPNSRAQVAYFSMEIGLNPLMPTYAGGLGVLAGDTIHSAADLGVPMVGVTLLHRRGYFYQRLDRTGSQSEEPVAWAIPDYAEPLEPRVFVEIEGRAVQVRAWRHLVTGMSGHTIPVYLLDTDLPDNSPWDRTITDSLYGGDAHYRLCQEMVLGFGGFALLRALGQDHIYRYHLNEGHAALLVLALIEAETRGSQETGRCRRRSLRRCGSTVCLRLIRRCRQATINSPPIWLTAYWGHVDATWSRPVNIKAP